MKKTKWSENFVDYLRAQMHTIPSNIKERIVARVRRKFEDYEEAIRKEERARVIEEVIEKVNAYEKTWTNENRTALLAIRELKSSLTQLKKL